MRGLGKATGRKVSEYFLLEVVDERINLSTVFHMMDQ